MAQRQIFFPISIQESLLKIKITVKTHSSDDALSSRFIMRLWKLVTILGNTAMLCYSFYFLSSSKKHSAEWAIKELSISKKKSKRKRWHI